MRSDSYIEFSRCRDYGQSSTLEWIDTNGHGAYAMGTVSGSRTRRYHSLLNAGSPTQVWLAALEDVIELDGARVELATHEYPGIVAPKGFELLREFRLAPHPTWLFQLGEATLAKEVLLIDGSPAVLVRYCCSENARLSLRPFIAGRHQHELLQAQPHLAWSPDFTPGHLKLTRGDVNLHMRCDSSEFVSKPDWYYRFQYPIDRQRGLDYQEDLWTPGELIFPLRADTWAYFVCGYNEDPGTLDPLQLIEAINRKERRFPAPRCTMDRLSNAAEHFIVRNTVIAGYPWFTDWGRDTFVSMPGLFLARHKQDEAARTIRNFLDKRSEGLIPNRITDDGSTPEYNSIDATLWLYIAVWQWLECGGSRQFFHDAIYPAIRQMIDRICQGTIYSIYRDPNDGLLHAGTPETQLTWMDARVNGRAVTPRSGKAVEINALWYNALRLMHDWAQHRGEGEASRRYCDLANHAIAGFTGLFWNEEKGCLYDVLGSDAIRPNQLFALSLPYPMVVRSKAESILKVVEEQLVTPMGLRTLSPADVSYQGRFEGGPEQRDNAYHQGTVWPWLFGPYVRACLKVRGNKDGLRQMLLDFVESQLDHGCLGQLAEVYDGDAPQREGGCPAQAWSVAEIYWLLSKELAS